MAARSYAFFDVDDTLIRTKSMFDFYRFFCEAKGRPTDFAEFEVDFSARRLEGVPREELNKTYYRYLAGTSPEDLRQAGELWWDSASARPSILVETTVSMLRELQEQGVDPIFVSGSFKEVLGPIARQLGVKHQLCAPMRLGDNGRYTGDLDGHPTIGRGKAQAIVEFLRISRASASDCWAFGDDISDLPMLELVGRPVAVGSQTALSTIATQRGWQVVGADLASA